jgi:hypothetical protein
MATVTMTTAFPNSHLLHIKPSDNVSGLCFLGGGSSEHFVILRSHGFHQFLQTNARTTNWRRKETAQAKMPLHASTNSDYPTKVKKKILKTSSELEDEISRHCDKTVSWCRYSYNSFTHIVAWRSDYCQLMVTTRATIQSTLIAEHVSVTVML